MSTHPNVLLIAVMTPDDLSRKTYRNILRDNGLEDEDGVLRLGNELVLSAVMETEYHDDYQVMAKEGDLIFFTIPTYGYGDSISWPDLVNQQKQLDEWAKTMSERHHCSYEIRVSANYW